MNHLVLVLKRTFDQKKRAARHYGQVALIEIGHDDDPKPNLRHIQARGFDRLRCHRLPEQDVSDAHFILN
jgi:hypothetical protein